MHYLIFSSIPPSENGVIKSDLVARTMTATDRKHYCPHNSYQDAPQSIGFDVTISAPHMHAFALELLEGHLKQGARVLDVGSGSGYLTACFARCVGPSGTVIGSYLPYQSLNIIA